MNFLQPVPCELSYGPGSIEGVGNSSLRHLRRPPGRKTIQQGEPLKEVHVRVNEPYPDGVPFHYHAPRRFC